jgi:SAM-dependent methyltransferase
MFMGKTLQEGLWIMRVSDLGEQLLLCCDADARLLLPEKMLSKQVAHIKGLQIFDLGSDNSEITELYNTFNLIPNMDLSRYLDRFHLLIRTDEIENRQKVLDIFFGLIACEYESLIDVQRNLDNIRNLLRFVKELTHLPEGSTIVDYGCGTGLSIKLIAEFNIKLIGVDSCPTMRQIAKSRGMVALGIGQLARKPKNSLDSAIASYVFHLLPQPDGLRLLWSRLKPEGVIVGNFHKNQGVEMVNSYIQALKGSVQLLESPNRFDKHGTYIAYLKKG